MNDSPETASLPGGDLTEAAASLGAASLEAASLGAASLSATSLAMASLAAASLTAVTGTNCLLVAAQNAYSRPPPV
jgi:uncharacterized protein YjbI with pentapeptide repeats